MAPGLSVMAVSTRCVCTVGVRMLLARTLCARLVLAVPLMAAGAGAAAGGAAPHPWADALQNAAIPAPDDPFSPTPLDALDLTATLNVDASHATASVHARYRLDAPDHVRRAAADARDLRTLQQARAESSRREALLDLFASRCHGPWRAWQVRLLDVELATSLVTTTDAAATAPDSSLGNEYLWALRDTLARRATSPGTSGDIAACRLEAWLEGVGPSADAPSARATLAEAALTERSLALSRRSPPATLWFDVSVAASRGASATTTLRAGLDLPLAPGGGYLSLTLVRTGASASLSWRPASLEERLAPTSPGVTPSGGHSGGDATTGSLLAAVLDRRDHARLARAQARRLWDASCGGADAESVHACLRDAAAGGWSSGDLVALIDAELAALHAELAFVSATGHDLATLLGATPAGTGTGGSARGPR